MSVHVAVDAHNLARDDRGIGRYARAVLRRALREPSFRWTFIVRDWFPNRRAMEQALGADAFTIAKCVPSSADVIWFPWNGTFLKSAAPSVATVHDAAPFEFPSRDLRIRAIEQTPFLRTAATARRILVQSQFTASEVHHWLGVERSRIVITPLGFDAVFHPGTATSIPARLRKRRYVLHVGAHDERKNTSTLIAGFARAFPRGDVTLVFTRRPPSMPDNAMVVGARDDAALADLYRGATAVVVPSTYEGFGLPLLEAMASGTPVLAARAGALPEVGENAVAWVDKPLEAKAWARGLSDLFEDDEQLREYAALGLERAGAYSWDRCAQQTLGVLSAASGN
jgi:alpha-1,3-rhamnosyl/mannosyltransferase